MASTRETNRSKSGYPPPTVSSNENVLVLSRSLISVRRVAASHDPSYFLLASSPRCPRLRVRFAVLFSLLVVARVKIHSRFPSVRTFLERETVAPTADVSRRLSPAIPRMPRGPVQATYTRVLITASGRSLAVESYIPLVNYVVDRVVSAAVIVRDAE